VGIILRRLIAKGHGAQTPITDHDIGTTKGDSFHVNCLIFKFRQSLMRGKLRARAQTRHGSVDYG
jgi:hypothetical protein